jgi:hypothetical protein
MVAGDFNGDGKDDIATFYDYGQNRATIHVWLAEGNGFSPSTGQQGWWHASGYNLSNVDNRMVAGDFDNTGVNIATLYGNGGVSASINTFFNAGRDGIIIDTFNGRKIPFFQSGASEYYSYLVVEFGEAAGRHYMNVGVIDSFGGTAEFNTNKPAQTYWLDPPPP